MTEQHTTAPDGAAMAAARLAEIDHLSERIRLVLTQMSDALDQDAGPFATEILTTLNQLHAAHLKVLTAEDVFHAKIGKTADDGALDFEAIRADIGRQLDRIRERLRKPHAVFGTGTLMSAASRHAQMGRSESFDKSTLDAFACVIKALQCHLY